MFIEPEKIHDATDQELSEAYEKILLAEKELEPEKQQIREELQARLGDDDARVFGNVGVSKQRRFAYAKIGLDEAREVGATYAVCSVGDAESHGIAFTEQVDVKMVEQMIKSGAKLNVPVTISIRAGLVNDD